MFFGKGNPHNALEGEPRDSPSSGKPRALQPPPPLAMCVKRNPMTSFVKEREDGRSGGETALQLHVGGVNLHFFLIPFRSLSRVMSPEPRGKVLWAEIFRLSRNFPARSRRFYSLSLGSPFFLGGGGRLGGGEVRRAEKCQENVILLLFFFSFLFFFSIRVGECFKTGCVSVNVNFVLQGGFALGENVLLPDEAGGERLAIQGRTPCWFMVVIMIMVVMMIIIIALVVLVIIIAILIIIIIAIFIIIIIFIIFSIVLL